MQNFKPSKLTIALLSTGMMAFGTPSFAEQVERVAQAETAKADADADESEEENKVVITGIRGSLQRAQAIKMDQDVIVEAISAEDIGKLPDNSVAESLARLPGVTGERRNGRTSGLSVRGFNENYVGTSLNGRELLGMGDNRGVEYDLYPTEIITDILVYKTPDATINSQGIGGSIDLQTINPLGAEKTMTINASYEQNGEDSPNPDFDNNGNRISFNYVDQFANDTVGFALTLASQESVRQENNMRVWGYPDSGVSAGDVVFGGHDTFVRSALLERDSVAAVLEFVPNDKLAVQIDALYVDFDERDVRRGIEEAGPEWGGGNYTASTASGGLVTSGYYDGFLSVIRNDSRRQQSSLTTIGANLEYQLDENWALEFDYSTGKVDKTLADVESYSGVGRAGIDGRPVSARSFEMTSNGVFFSPHPTVAPVDFTDPNLVRLAGPQSWGGGLNAIPRFGGDGSNAQDGFINRPEFDESLDTIRFEADGVVDFGIFTNVTVGIVYSDREKSKVNNGAFLTAETYPGDGPIPNPLGLTDLSFFGLGQIIAYDGLALVNSGFYEQTDAALVDNSRLGDTYTVNEKLTTIYAKLDFESELGDIPVSGNIGARFVNTDQNATGFSTVSDQNGLTLAVPVTDGADYSDILPSLNVSFELTESQFIRFGASTVQTRPRMDDMRPNTQVNFQFNDTNILEANDVANGPWSGSSGNAKLKPLEANQYDLSYENYFADDGFFAISFFYKDLTNWHRNGTSIFDATSIYVPTLHQTSTGLPPVLFEGILNFREDGLTGSVRGQEYQANIPFHLLSESLEGLGLQFSATFLDGALDDDTNPEIPGMSDESYSVTAYYERNGWEFRVSGTKRDPFQTQTRGLSLSLVGANRLGAELIDAQVSYDFDESGIEWAKGLRVSLQAQNLGDEIDVEANDGDARQITQFASFGATYLLSLNYDF